MIRLKKYSLNPVICTLVCFQLGLASAQQMEANTSIDPADISGCEEIIEPDMARAAGPTFWPNAIVPYVRYGDFREQDHQALDEALEDFHTKTCIRFTPRVEEKAYVEIMVNLSLTRICGRAVFCNVGRPQWVEIAGHCSNKKTIVHELGHTLCLHHEQNRYDRDDYLDFSECSKPETISPKSDWWNMRDNIYDYGSIMHYVCRGYPCFGTCKKDRLVKCGNNLGLGPLDADKLNAFYKCQGCHAHRWFRVDTLTHEQEAMLVDFSNPAHDTQPVYMCRGFVYGEILVGKYLREEKACLLGSWAVSHKITTDIQVFGISDGSRQLRRLPDVSAGSGYVLVNPLDVSTNKLLVPVGRSGRHDNPPYFAAINTNYADADGKLHTLVGIGKEGGSKASFVTPDKGHVWVKHTDAGSQEANTMQYFSIACLNPS